MLKNQKGFSLVELMIVVAIIGILAAIAIPNYQKFQEKAKQAEAKGDLAGIFTAESAFFAEYNLYYPALDYVGYVPNGAMNYAAGFNATTAVTLPATAPAFPAGETVGGCFQTCSGPSKQGTGCATATLSGYTCTSLAMAPATATAVVAAGGVSFVATAQSLINPAATLGDIWTIDNNNNLSNISSGL